MKILCSLFTLLSLFIGTSPLAQATPGLSPDPIEISDGLSKKIFYALSRSGARMVVLNHHHDREYAQQESITVTELECEISLTPTCSFFSETESGSIHKHRLSGQDAWDVGFNLGEGGVSRVVVSSQKHRVAASQVRCVLKGAGKSATCLIHE